MNLHQLSAVALIVADGYDQVNLHARGLKWSNLALAMGFVGDVGDLAKLVMEAEGLRVLRDGGRAALEHEISDGLWSLLVLAARYGIDAERAFLRTMAELRTGIDAQLYQAWPHLRASPARGASGLLCLVPAALR